MSAQPNFADILDRPASETEKPKPLPAGSYSTVVTGLPRRDVSSKKKTPFVEFILKITGALDDVSEEDLAAWSTRADGGKKSLTEATVKATYYLTEDALWRLKEFIEHCGIEVPEGASYSQLIEELPNCQVGANLRHRASEDGASIFAELAKTFPIEG